MHIWIKFIIGTALLAILIGIKGFKLEYILPQALVIYFGVINIYNFALKKDMYPGNGELKHQDKSKIKFYRLIFALICTALILLLFYK